MSSIKNFDGNNAHIHDEQESHPSNHSDNRPFADVLKTLISRRKVVRGGLTAAAAGFLAPQQAAALSLGSNKGQSDKPLVGFQPVTIEQHAAESLGGTMPVISSDYEYQVLIPWGTPIEPNATEEYTGDPSYRPTSEQAEKQIGLGHDGMWFFPAGNSDYRDDLRHGFRLGNNKGMLCINHEYGTNSHALGKSFPESLEDVRLSQAIHGVSVVALERKHHHWEVVNSPNSRRITVNTPVVFSGPAANSDLLQNPNGNIPLGTVNNCGSGSTPWGTYLTCEENFNGYFGTTFAPDTTGLTDEEIEALYDAENERVLNEIIAADPKRGDAYSRYGFSITGFGYGWQFYDRRFNLTDTDYVNEANRFGWIVEIDPKDGTQKPVKRTALGRFKHEAIAIAEAPNGRVLCYMGDDQRFDYCYKFKSDLAWKTAVDSGHSPLDTGVLYVARFNDDGTGDWLPLDINLSPVLATYFANQEEVLIYARLAADMLGATPMDRPEWTTIGQDNTVFWTLTNNSDRTEANAANPEAPNSDGHIIRTKDTDNGLGDSFEWEIFILASQTQGTEAVFTDPDAAYADPYGRLFIGTDGGQPDGLQDQLTVFDTTEKGPRDDNGNPIASRLFVGVNSDEITGWTHTPDCRTAFTNMQHPGNGSPSSTNFPAQPDGVTIPRDCTLVITRKDGEVVGS